jgi:hypothetical protein
MAQGAEIRMDSVELCAQARALVSRAEGAATTSGALQAQGARRRGEVEPAAKQRERAIVCAPPPPETIEQAAERAFLMELTAREIADHLEQPVDLVLVSADRTALSEARPIDDVLRDWFRALLG